MNSEMCQLNVVGVGMGAQSLGLPPIKCIRYADLGEMPFFQGESGALEVRVGKVVFLPGLEGGSGVEPPPLHSCSLCQGIR